MQTIETNPIDRFVNVTVLRSGDHVFYNLVFFVTIFMSIVTVSIPFLASAQTPPSATAPAGRLSTLPTTETDQATQSLLNAVIARDSSLTEMKAEVSSGVVYLSGDVDSQKKLDWVNGIAQRLPNVLAVDNDLKIRGVALDGMEPVLGEVNRLILRLKQNLPILLFAVLFLALSYFLSSALNRGVRSLLGRKISNPFVLSIVTRLVLLPVWVLLFYLALRLLGLSALGATLIGGTGVLGIVLGLAFKGIAENFLAGLLLASRSPFTRGDIIQIGKYQGYVENLNMRGTTIIDLNGNLILIPNLTVIQSIVENQTANPKTRTSFTVGIGYQDSISQAQDVIIKAVSNVDGVIDDPAPNVIVNELAGTNVELKVFVWFNSKKNRETRVRSRAMIKTKESLLANGFTIPGETRELVFTNAVKFEKLDAPSKTTEDHEQERKNEIQKQAAINLAEPDSKHATEDPSPEDMLKLAENNPLPMNSSQDGLLRGKKATDV